MKKLIWFIVGIIVIFYFLRDDDTNSQSSSVTSSPASGSNAGNEQVLQLIKREESKIIEAFISDADVLYVSVVDDD